ncbi:MAG: 23S rRNA (pseudouridine(1915)-N(3))-methyltransferase RlmH [Fusobacteriaceae bacterium]|nr:23S rRNA (pseudouridine(1915)-N(3))-methyltransferase RlmH [Fusobacteriaceae bacterium]
MNISILCVGKIKERYLAEGCGEYAKRLSPWVSLRVMEVKEEAEGKNTSLAAEKESREILKIFKKTDAFRILLAIRGERLTSERFAAKMEQWITGGNSHFLFVIGGSNGVTEEVEAAADLRLSFSDFTFPHQLMRLILLEQLYRCFSILNNGKYHK